MIVDRYTPFFLNLMFQFIITIPTTKPRTIVGAPADSENNAVSNVYAALDEILDSETLGMDISLGPTTTANILSRVRALFKVEQMTMSHFDWAEGTSREVAIPI